MFIWMNAIESNNCVSDILRSGLVQSRILTALTPNSSFNCIVVLKDCMHSRQIVFPPGENLAMQRENDHGMIASSTSGNSGQSKSSTDESKKTAKVLTSSTMTSSAFQHNGSAMLLLVMPSVLVVSYNQTFAQIFILSLWRKLLRLWSEA